MRAIILLAALFSSLLVQAQIQSTTNLFSKMDIAPQHTLWDEEQTMLMGFTGLMSAPIDIPGPTLVYTEGDSVQIDLRNMSQVAPHTIHLHGLDVDQWNDGVPHLSFEVGHNETKSYFFKAPHPGTYLYHCHVVSSLHVQAGMYGLLIIKPEEENITWDGGYSFDSDYAWMTSEIDTVWHQDSVINYVADTSEHTRFLPDYNPQYFLVNGRSEQQLNSTAVAAINATANETMLLRLANIGYYGNKFHFPMHLNARVISSDGRPFPTIEYSDTLVVLPGERYQVLLQATYEFEDQISVDYFDLNTQQTHNTQTVPVDISGYMSTTEETVKNARVYPNPVSNELFIENVDGEVALFDVFGKLVLKAKISEESSSITVEGIPSGIYFLNTELETIKISVQ